MQGARIVYVVYRDSILRMIGRILRQKGVIISLVIMVAGIALFNVSLHQSTITHTDYYQAGAVTATYTSGASIYFSQLQGIPSHITFNSASSVDFKYSVYSVLNYSTPTGFHQNERLITSGVVSNGTILTLQSTSNPLGRECRIVLTPLQAGTYNVNVSVMTIIPKVEQANSSMGIPASLAALAGLMAMSASIAGLYRKMKNI